MPNETPYAGPLTSSPEQLPSIIALLNRVFYANKPFTVTNEFPLVCCPRGLNQLRVFTSNSEPVAHAATVINEVSAFGCRLGAACLGAVCTDEPHRGRGLAGELVDDAISRAAAAGATIMLISGHRPLYTSRGAHKPGIFQKFTVAADSAPRQGNLTVSEISAEDCPRALELYESEPLHFCRSVEQYTSQTSTGFVMNRQGKTYVIRGGPDTLAVLTVWHSRCDSGDAEESVASVEFAGSRPAIVAALPVICREYQATRAEIISYAHDQALLGACRDLGIEPELVPFDFSVRLLDAQRLWDDFQPLLAERLNGDMLSDISLHPQADELEIHTLTFRTPGEEFTVQGSQQILAALFGSTELDSLAQATGQLGQALRQAFPLPLPQYGLNFL